MKEKIKKVFYTVFSWQGVMWLNLILFAIYVVAAAYHRNATHLLAGFPQLMYAFFCWLLTENEKKFQRAVSVAAMFKIISDTAIERLERYKKLYGELPPEEETKEEEKKEEQ